MDSQAKGRHPDIHCTPASSSRSVKKFWCLVDSESTNSKEYSLVQPTNLIKDPLSIRLFYYRRSIIYLSLGRDLFGGLPAWNKVSAKWVVNQIGPFYEYYCKFLWHALGGTCVHDRRKKTDNDILQTSCTSKYCIGGLNINYTTFSTNSDTFLKLFFVNINFKSCR